jgi:prephenate dehydrogenase (NADP+)
MTRGRGLADLPDSPIRPLPNGHAVSRISDLIIYSVESSSIIPIVAEYGPSTKLGATIAGQTSVKAPEKEAFEKYLPADVDIVSVHSLHGPTVTTEGQPLVSLHSSLEIGSWTG